MLTSAHVFFSRWEKSDECRREKYASIVINYFWGKGTTTPETVTERAVIVAFEALEQASMCSRNMDLVPRPYIGPMNNLKYPMKEILKIGKRIEDDDTGGYFICKKEVSRTWRTRILEALWGI